jgi:hypothetical protein
MHRPMLPPVLLGTTLLAMTMAGTTLVGCTAIRGTVHLAKAEQAYALANDADAETWAPYPHTMAESFMLKAREEWGYSDFGPAEDFSKLALEWSTKAAKQADAADKTQPPPTFELLKKGPAISAAPPTPAPAQPAPQPVPQGTP